MAKMLSSENGVKLQEYCMYFKVYKHISGENRRSYDAPPNVNEYLNSERCSCGLS